MKVTRVSEMRTLDQTAIEHYGIPEELLMENAGQAVYVLLQEQCGIRGKNIVVLCGLGNNGGDGFVVARLVHSSGGSVKVYILGSPDRFTGAAKANLDILSRLPVEIHPLSSVEAVQYDVAHCDAIVDAIFGTGLSREITGLHREVIEAMNASRARVVSVDIPSGVHGDTGRIMGAAVKADYTVTFGLPKIGNLLFPGYDHCGALYVSHISFPPVMYTDDAIKIAINRPARLPPRLKTGHKGDFGDVLFIAGAANYFGAPYFAAQAFLKAGGGYARLAAPAAMTPFLATRGSEIVFLPQRETQAGSLALANQQALIDASEGVDMVVLGPGLSMEPETQQLARELTRAINKPLVIDGDGITAISGDLDLIRHRQVETILTPHVGEMSRIIAQPAHEIEARKLDILQDTARDLGAIIVLKGAHSLIGYPDESVFINLSGNSGMATPGSGDVLTGAIAAMFGLGLSLFEAVREGVFIHGLAGDLAAGDVGEDGVIAQTILDYLPRAMTLSRQGIPGPLGARYLGARML